MHHPLNERSVEIANWYWTSTTAAPANDHAWYVNLDGGRLFFGGDDEGHPIPCENSGHDGEYRSGIVWPEPRFITNDSGVMDCLTGCRWSRSADLADGPFTWCEAIAAVSDLRRTSDNAGWRLPNINELESLVDCAYAAPALSPSLPFTAVHEVYWSVTTSLYEPNWA